MLSPYQKYQLEWMIAHGFSLDDLIAELTQVQYADPEDHDQVSTPVNELFVQFVEDVGFGGELWACEREWAEYEGRES